MTIEKFMATRGLTLAQFAELVGMSDEGIRLIVSGKRQPRHSTAIKIEEATGGDVTFADLMSSFIKSANSPSNAAR